MRRLIVQKYGGSSVATPQRMAAVAQKVLNRKLSLPEGYQIAVVVSAMGDTTDRLLAQAAAIHQHPATRELDLLLSTGEVAAAALLALALQAVGVPAVALTGGQAGIHTDGAYGRAAIAELAPERIEAALAAGQVPVIAGFQGVSAKAAESEITTLGRGGSDTTAVALSISLGAEWCEICTDVAGIFTADPRIVPSARQLVRISPIEMLELAQQGARVMHPRSVELGGAYLMPILVRSSFNEQPGTWIIPASSRLPANDIPDNHALCCKEPIVESRNKISGIAHDTNIAKLMVMGVSDPEFTLARLFSPLAAAGINVDAISHTAEPGGTRANCTFTVAEDDLLSALQVTRQTAQELGAAEVHHQRAVGKVSVVGLGVQDTPGLAAKAFSVLGAAGIAIDMVTTSQIRITCLVPEDRLADAVRLLHAAFDLENVPSVDGSGQDYPTPTDGPTSPEGFREGREESTHAAI